MNERLNELMRPWTKATAKALVTDLGGFHKAVAVLVDADERFDRAHRAWEDARFLGEDFTGEKMQKIAAEYEDATMARIDALDALKAGSQ